MPSYLDESGEVVNPQYINPASNNKQFGQFQNKNLNAVGTVAGMAGSQLQGSESQNLVSQAGPWGAAIGTASKLITNLADTGINYNRESMGFGEKAAAYVKGYADPAGTLMDKNLSTKERLVGGLLLPGMGGIFSARAKKRKIAEAKRKATDQSIRNLAAQQSQEMEDLTPDVQVMKSGGWISKAINPKHVGYCTPLSKPTCTGHRRALAVRFKKGGDLHKKAYGGYIKDDVNIGNTKLLEYGGKTHEESPIGGTPVDANGLVTTPSKADALVEKNEVAWNKGKDDTYVFSDRLGFAKEAKKIMNRYHKRLGKNLDGADDISKNTMNLQLNKLQNAQEATKIMLNSANTEQLANGGPINNNGEAAPTFSYPDTSEKFQKFKEDLEQSQRAKDFARLYHYKQLLDPLLKSKDVTGYQTYTKDIPVNLKDRITKAEEAYKSGYSGYVDIPEMQKALGTNYSDYVSLMNKFQKPEMGITGFKEGEQPTENIKYGLRTSMSITPYKNVGIINEPNTKKPRAQFEADVFYNPTTASYEYKYAKPKEFKCGGQIKKMADGGNIGETTYQGREKLDIPTEDKFTGEVKKDKKEKTYLGDMVPIAGSTGLSLLGTGYALSRLKKPEKVKFGRITPKLVNLERARESLRTASKEGLANIRSAAKGVSSPNYMNEVITGTVGTQRELGKNLTQSYLAEEAANAEAMNEAARTNLATEIQEAGINVPRLDRYRDTKAKLISNLFTIPGLGVTDYLKQKNIKNAAALNSAYELVTDPNDPFNQILRLKKGEK